MTDTLITAPAASETSASRAHIVALSRAIAENTSTGVDGAAAAALAWTSDSVPTARWASLTQRKPSGHLRTISSAGAHADAADQLQYHLGEGPTVDALDGELVRSDLETEPRWPRLTPRLQARTPVRSVLSIPLAFGGHPHTVINLYSDQPGGYQDVAPAAIELVTAQAALVLTAVLQHRRADNLEVALNTSRQIGAALGILMNQHHWTNDQAFDVLRLVSQTSHRKLSDIADEVLFTGALPDVAAAG